MRDEHGRFPGKASLPFRAGFIKRPVVDEYGRLLRQWLREANLSIHEPSSGFSGICLTHDVDVPFLYRSWKGVVRSLLAGRGLSASLKGRYDRVENDPYYTFPWFFAQKELYVSHPLFSVLRSILFFRAGGKMKEDRPHYSLENKDIKALIEECKQQGVEVGLHASYEASRYPELIKKEMQALKKQWGDPVLLNRHHFLAAREPEDMAYLERAGITDDFTMGYADVAGFRLGTCRPVLWINPQTRKLSTLTLHPLTIMDGTLEKEKYMHLNLQEAYAYCSDLIDQVHAVHGEISLLWHNTSATEEDGNYLKELYPKLLKKIMEK